MHAQSLISVRAPLRCLCRQAPGGWGFAMDWGRVRLICFGFAVVGVARVALDKDPAGMALPALAAIPLLFLVAVGFVWLEGALARYNARKEADKRRGLP